MRDLTKESGDLSGISALQLYIQGKGGNGTRYVCAYTRDRAVQRTRCTVHKLVYFGQADGLEASIYGRGGDEESKPIAHAINCSMRGLNEELSASTRALCRTLEIHSRQTILHLSAQFIIDENEVHTACHPMGPPLP